MARGLLARHGLVGQQFALEPFGLFLVAALDLGEMQEHLAQACIKRLCGGTIIEIRSLDLHQRRFGAHLLGLEVLGPPHGAAGEEVAHILAADGRQMLAESLAIEIEQHRTMASLLLRHALEQLGGSGEFRGAGLGEALVDAAILFLVGDGERQHLTLGEIGDALARGKDRQEAHRDTSFMRSEQLCILSNDSKLGKHDLGRTAIFAPGARIFRRARVQTDNSPSGPMQNRKTFCLQGNIVRYIELFVKRNVSFFNAVSLEPSMTFSLSRRQALGVVLGGAIAAPSILRAQAIREIRIDWATYNPLSLILRDQKLLEKEFEKDNIAIRWVQSAGSNKALEFLNAGSIDFGSTAGAAALLGKINGNPIQAISVFSRPEWTALVTRPGKGVSKVADLKGKSIAVTRGTDPHIFLIRALAEVGLKERDARLVLLQHADGRTALARGDVDAWAGLDPLMAAAELEDGATLFHRKPEHNTWGILNTPTAFAEKNPEIVRRVINVYEAARKAALADIKPVQASLVAAARLPEAVIARQLTRTDLSTSAIGKVQAETITAAGVALQEAGVIKADVDVKGVVASLIEPKFTAHLAA